MSPGMQYPNSLLNSVRDCSKRQFAICSQQRKRIKGSIERICDCDICASCHGGILRFYDFLWGLSYQRIASRGVQRACIEGGSIALESRAQGE